MYTDVYSPSAGGCPNPNAPGQPVPMAFLANNSYFTPTAGAATMQGCGNLAQLQRGGVELGSTSEAIPSDAEWLSWARDYLHMES